MNARDEKPLAKREGVLTQRIGSELVVVDTGKSKAHCLNEASLFVWEQCDGETTLAQIASRVEDHFGHSEGWDVTQLALRQLLSARLLEGRPELEQGMDRRAFISRAALVAAAIPVVASIIVPGAAQSASCVPKGGPCIPGTVCCPPSFCNLAAGKCVG